MPPTCAVATIRSLNVGSPESLVPGRRPTGIRKQAVSGPLRVSAPGPKGAGGGVAGDSVCDGRHHGGDYQAVYAYACEDLAFWEAELGRPLPPGTFGENFTTLGADLTGAVVGERWRVGPSLVLAVTVPRIPCATFQLRMGEKGWVKRFTRACRPGTYLQVVRAGEVRAGDGVSIEDRPAHGVTIGVLFRALTLEPALLSVLAGVEGLPPELRSRAPAGGGEH